MNDPLRKVATGISYAEIPNSCDDLHIWRNAHIETLARAMKAETTVMERDEEIEAMHRKIHELERELRVMESRE